MFLKTWEEKILPTEEALHEALSSYESRTRWLRVTAKEIRCVGLSDTPILTLDEKAAVIDSCLAEEDESDAEAHFEECVKGTGLFLTLPDGSGVPGRTITRPVRETAYESVLNRSGTGGRCMRRLENGPKHTAWTAERRGKDADDGFATSSESVKVLLSDGMVTFIGSDVYAIIPLKGGVKAAEDAIRAVFESAEYRGGFISHEYLMAEWAVKSAETEAHRLLLTELGVIHPDTEVKYIFRFGSSNIGDAKMKGRMLVSVGGLMIPLGEPQGVWHKTTRAAKDRKALTSGSADGCTLSDFSYKLENFLAASLKENEDVIEEMGNRTVKHPSGCAQRLLEGVGSIPAAVKADIVDGLRNPAGDVTQIDVYLAICGALEKLDGLYSAVLATEDVAQLLNKNWTAFDKPERKEGA